MTADRLLELLTRPIYTARLIAYRIYEMWHPEEPWIAQGAVRFCDQHLDRDSDGLEFGSGRSTTWFAKRLRKLTSVEQSREWHAIVQQTLADQNVTNVDYRFVALNHPRQAPTHARYDVTPDYVRVADEFADESLGMVVVDGHYRQACVLAVVGKIKPGGYLLIDNSNYCPMSEWNVPPDWPIVHESENVRTQTTIWQKPLAKTASLAGTSESAAS